MSKENPVQSSENPVQSTSGRFQRGFSLVELMVVVTIVGILATVAYPSYSDFVVRSKRSEGKAALLDVSQGLERSFTNNNTYPADLAVAGLRTFSGGGVAAEAAYTIAIAAGATGTLASSYTLTATPANGHADARCGVLSLNQLGIRGSTGTATVQECW